MVNGYTYKTMKSINTRLFLTLLGLTFMVLVFTIGLAKWSFEYGFLDYRRSLEVERLKIIATSLEAHYERSEAQWNSETPREFDRIYLASLPHHRGNRDRHELRPPPPRHDLGKVRDDTFNRKPEKRPPIVSRHETALFDVQGNHIAGDVLQARSSNLISLPLYHSNKPIGELRAPFIAKAVAPEEKAFASQQAWASGIIALFAIILASMASWLLSRTLLTPIFSLKKGISSLAKGNFSVDLPNSNKDELGELMADINHLSTILKENRTSRRRWLADISHELRTPVTILAGEVEAMRDGVRRLDADGIDSLAHEIDRLKHLIEDLYELSLSDVGGLRYEFEDIDLVDSLRSTAEAFIPRAQAEGLKLSVNGKGPYYVSGDAARLEQLFINILNNSIYYTDSPGVIDLNIYQEKGQAVITVEDSSPGVASVEFDSLFEPLYRNDSSRNRSVGGAGLGLSICKNIIDAHQGQVFAEHSSLGGIRITIKIPAVEPKNDRSK